MCVRICVQHSWEGRQGRYRLLHAHVQSVKGCDKGGQGPGAHVSTAQGGPCVQHKRGPGSFQEAIMACMHALAHVYKGGYVWPLGAFTWEEGWGTSAHGCDAC